MVEKLTRFFIPSCICLKPTGFLSELLDAFKMSLFLGVQSFILLWVCVLLLAHQRLPTETVSKTVILYFTIYHTLH